MDGTVPETEAQDVTVSTSPAAALTGPQEQVDAEEREAELRYQRWRDLGDAIVDAVRRAEALTRLEHLLAFEAR